MLRVSLFASHSAVALTTTVIGGRMVISVAIFCHKAAVKMEAVVLKIVLTSGKM